MDKPLRDGTSGNRVGAGSRARAGTEAAAALRDLEDALRTETLTSAATLLADRSIAEAARWEAVPVLIPASQAGAFGISDHRLRRHCVKSAVRGVVRHPDARANILVPHFADAAWLEVHEFARALHIARPGTVVEGASAARLYGLPLPPGTPATPIETACRPGRHPTGLARVRTRATHAIDARPWFGVQLNSPLNVLAVLAGHMREDDLVAIVDALAGPFNGPPLHTVDEIARALTSHKGKRGIRALSRAIARARPGVRSPKETEWRLRIVDAGMPEPRVNHRVWISPGRHREIDLAFEEYKVACEFHGKDHHLRFAAQVADDNKRRLELERLGWKVIVITSERPAAQQLNEIRYELEARGWRR